MPQLRRVYGRSGMWRSVRPHGDLDARRERGLGAPLEPRTTAPAEHEERSARQARHEDHDAVHDCGGDPAVRPSRGPQPARLGSTMASIASSASGSSRETDASAPAVRAAIMNVTAWPPTN